MFLTITFLQYIFYFVCMGGCLRVFLCTVCIFDVPGGHKRALDSPATGVIDCCD